MPPTAINARDGQSTAVGPRGAAFAIFPFPHSRHLRNARGGRRPFHCPTHEVTDGFLCAFASSKLVGNARVMTSRAFSADVLRAVFTSAALAFRCKPAPSSSRFAMNPSGQTLSKHHVSESDRTIESCLESKNRHGLLQI